MTNDDLIAKAQSVLCRRTINGRLHGDVGAALLTDQGNVYTGVCVDTAGWGLCAERSAIAAMITAGEYTIQTIVAVWQEDQAIDPDGQLQVLAPCGYCRQFMRDINDDNLETAVILGRDKIVKLIDLLPYHEWPNPLAGQASAL
ncbi:MAG TPA: cytidine deaminase [Actinomycetota bacterium]|jgi:cytidine deaminase|nr:cytidine deaminase [Actinomycetota bacterium]